MKPVLRLWYNGVTMENASAKPLKFINAVARSPVTNACHKGLVQGSGPL